ncbi:MAG TPA: DUF488 family protein [Thermomicrobiales bacterium]|nr:DUF488 family protein [Thermomicrobiales bacterium]
MIKTKRAYDGVSDDDGVRFLVDRLWPRGIRKDDLQIEGWVKDASPSSELRKMVHGDPSTWDEFERRYIAELEANPEAWQPLVDAARSGAITLVYSAKDTERNNATVLKAFLEKHLP